MAWVPLTFNRAAPAPLLPTAVAVAGGGTFAAGLKYWKISAIDAFGESLPSSEVSANIALNGSATIGWAAVPGATGYRIYRGTAPGGESLYFTVGAVVTFTDTGAAGTAGTPATALTAGTTIEVNILTDGASETESDKMGGSERTMSGRLRSSITDEKRNWQFNAATMLLLDFETFRNMVKNGTFVTGKGTLIGNTGAGFLCTVTIGASDFVEDTTVPDLVTRRFSMLVRSAA